MTTPAKDNTKAKVGLAGLKILIVEDLIANLLLYELTLERAGIQMVLNATGLNIAASVDALGGQVDLVILDLMLPDNVSGFDVMKEIRTDVRLKDVPVLAISARDANDIIAPLKDAGFMGLISKPLAYEKLPRQLLKVYRRFTFESKEFVYIPSERLA